MRNNRKIRLSREIIKNYNLMTSKPPKNSIFWKLWDSSFSIAEKTLSTDFIQAIKHGTLDPSIFGAFNVDDGYYCFNGADDYLYAEKKTTDKLLKLFLQKKYESYNTYNESFKNIWHIKDASSVIPLDITSKYSDFERDIVVNNDAIYSLIVMLPCDYLWYWFSQQIINDVSPNNLYKKWVEDNIDPSGAYIVGNVLDLYTNDIDINKAITIYKTAMEFELNNFIEIIKHGTLNEQ